MINSMDEIIIRFGSKRITSEERKRIARAKIQLVQMEEIIAATSLSFFKKAKRDLQKFIANETKSKEMPIKEFLRLDKKELSEKEQQIQRILSFLYKQNASDTPIYKNFPNRGIPLVIDCTTGSHKGTAGTYYNGIHTVQVGNCTEKDVYLVEVLAHELKHAEHWIDNEEEKFNAYQYHQIGFLKEAQANACGKWARSQYEKEFPQLKKELPPEERLLLALFGEEPKMTGSMVSKDMAMHLNNFLDDEIYVYAYKDTYDARYPILYDDKGLTRVPSAFGIEKKDEVKILKILNSRIPRRARTADNLVIQALKNNDFERIEKLLPNKNKNDEYMVSDELKDKLMICECYRDIKLFNAFQKSGRLSKEDLDDFIGTILHFSEDEELKENEMQERQKVFAKVISLKDDKGNFILSGEDIRKHIEFAEIESAESKELVRLVKPYLKKRDTSKLIRSKNDHAI